MERRWPTHPGAGSCAPSGCPLGRRPYGQVAEISIPLKGTGAPDLDSEAWENSKAIAYKYYSRKVAKAPPISFRGILGLRKQPCSLIEPVRGSLSHTYDADEIWKF